VQSGDTLSGVNLGSTVDREVTQITKLLVTHRVSLSIFMGTEDVTHHCEDIDGGHALAGWRLQMHDYTKRFMRLLINRGWEPIGSQVVCGSSDARMGTAVDLVVRDTRNNDKIVVIELKCGFDRYLDRFHSQMLPPFEHMTDCPRFQFQVQLLMTRILFMRTFPRLRDVQCVVVQVTQSTVNVIPLDVLFVRLGAEAWKVVCKSLKASGRSKKKTQQIVRAVENPVAVAPPTVKSTRKPITRSFENRPRLKPKIVQTSNNVRMNSNLVHENKRKRVNAVVVPQRVNAVVVPQRVNAVAVPHRASVVSIPKTTNGDTASTSQTREGERKQHLTLLQICGLNIING
jgi:hypothetical protein